MSECVSLEELKHAQQMFANNNWQLWVEKPQWLLCSILTTDLDKAEKFMKSKNVVKEERWSRNEKHWITSNNERWVWKQWDRLLPSIRKDIFDKAIHAWSRGVLRWRSFNLGGAQ